MMYARISALCVMLLMSACAQPLSVTTTPATPTVAQPPQPRPVEVQPVNIQVITTDNIAQITREFHTHPQTVMLMLSVQDYESLILNVGDVRRYVQQQTALIEYYQTMVTGLTTARPAPP